MKIQLNTSVIKKLFQGKLPGLQWALWPQLNWLTWTMKKDKQIRVNICWELGAERKCETLNKDHAYATRKYIEDNDGVVFWFQPLDD